jgi:hypothetical protein
VYDSNGTLVPNAYLFNMDYLGSSGTNYDYQDNIYYVENIRPESALREAASGETLAETAIIKDIWAYPNPSPGNGINLNAINFGRNEKVTISISTNMSDRVLHTQTFVTDDTGSANLLLTLSSDLERGIYIISAQSESGMLRSKLLVE